MPEKAVAKIVLYTMQGQLVSEICNDVMPAGKQVILADPENNLKSGIYLLNFCSGKYTETIKVVKMK